MQRFSYLIMGVVLCVLLCLAGCQKQASSNSPAGSNLRQSTTAPDASSGAQSSSKKAEQPVAGKEDKDPAEVNTNANRLDNGIIPPVNNDSPSYLRSQGKPVGGAQDTSAEKTPAATDSNAPPNEINGQRAPAVD